MKNIDHIDAFIYEKKNGTTHNLTYLNTEHGVTTHGSTSWDHKTVLANYIYHADDTYKLIYSLIDNFGNVENFLEEEGILPTLFLSPTDELYVSLITYHPDKEMELSIPLLGQRPNSLPKATRPFTGDFIGNTEQYSLFYDIDPFSGNKQDKMLCIEFKDGMIKKKHQIKIPMPKNNKVFMENGEIHLLAKDQDGWLHRMIDVKGEVIKQRQIQTNRLFFREALYLSFDSNSYLLAEEEGGKLVVDCIDTNGSTNSSDLYSLGDMLYNTWPPIEVGKDTFVTRFNTEFGNGWLTTREQKLLELFYSRDKGSYTNLLNGEQLDIDEQSLIISSINHTIEDHYSVVFYPKAEDGKPKNIIVLNRKFIS